MRRINFRKNLIESPAPLIWGEIPRFRSCGTKLQVISSLDWRDKEKVARRSHTDYLQVRCRLAGN
jgi:hypothetical protein